MVRIYPLIFLKYILIHAPLMVASILVGMTWRSFLIEIVMDITQFK